MDTKQTEIKQAGAPKAPKKKGKNPFASNKFKRGGMATLLTVVFIAIVVVVNVLATALTERFPSMDIDMTAQKVNTLSDQALDVAKGVEQKTTIYLIGSENAYDNNQIYSSYGLEYSQVASLSKRLAEANGNISVQFVDPDTNPTFISQYAEESLTTGKVMVQTERRYRVLSVSDLFTIEQDQTSGSYNTYSMVDSALAAAIESVNLDKVPIVAVATGHNELLNSSSRTALDSLLEEENFDVQEVNLLTDEIPEDTQVLMLPTPTTDYTEEELQKMRDFLSKDGPMVDRTLFVTCHPTQGELPKFAGFLEEWGVKVEEGVVAETDTSRVFSTNASYIFADSAEEVLKDNTYNLLVSPTTAPLTILFNANDDIGVQKLWVSSDSAYAAKEDGDTENPETSEQVLATLSSRMVQDGNDIYTKNVVVFGSSVTFTDTFLSTSTFSDRTYLTDLFHYVTGTDDSAVTVVTDKVQTNKLDIAASSGTLSFLGLGVFTIGLPLIILIAGLVVFLKRRHL